MPKILIEIVDGIAIDGFLPGGVAGLAYSYTLTARYAVEPLTWSADALPPGLSIDSDTGEVSGTVAVEGEHLAFIRLTDALGNTSTRRWLVSFALPFDPCADYHPEPLIGGTLRIGGDATEYGNVTQLTGGTLHICNRIV